LDTSIKHYNFNENTLIWAIIGSILLHALLATTLPNFKFDVTKEKPTELVIELVQPNKPELPAVEALPEPIKQEPIRSEVKPEPIKKIVPPKPAVKIERPEPAPTENINQEPEAAAPQVPAVIAAESKPDITPVITAPQPQPEPPKPTEPTDDDLNSARNQYGSTLGRAIAKHKSYPKIAQTRGWQGECWLDLKMDSNGNLLSASIKESSGYESLDKQALEMVRKASPFPSPPDALRGRSFNITVPVSFKLE
jgi:periplasmic protein TonB